MPTCTGCFLPRCCENWPGCDKNKCDPGKGIRRAALDQGHDDVGQRGNHRSAPGDAMSLCNDCARTRWHARNPVFHRLMTPGRRITPIGCAACCVSATEDVHQARHVDRLRKGTHWLWDGRVKPHVPERLQRLPAYSITTQGVMACRVTGPMK